MEQARQEEARYHAAFYAPIHYLGGYQGPQNVYHQEYYKPETHYEYTTTVARPIYPTEYEEVSYQQGPAMDYSHYEPVYEKYYEYEMDYPQYYEPEYPMYEPEYPMYEPEYYPRQSTYNMYEPVENYSEPLYGHQYRDGQYYF